MSRKLSDEHMISVIVPVHKRGSRLHEIMGAVASSSTPAELIIVINNKELEGTITPEHPQERVVVCEKRGRGHAFVRGAIEARGDITLLLHSDTVLPSGWDRAIAESLEDSHVVGGGFSLSYDIQNLYLRSIIRISDVLARITGEIWGDRAMFVRTKVLRQCLPAIDVPQFEDVRLSKCMRQCGKIVLLKQRVVTSADGYKTHGMIGHLRRIVKSRIWYAFGGDPQRIYEFYYSS